MISELLEKVLQSAYAEAKKRCHMFFTLEHLLYAIINTDEGVEIIEASGGDIPTLCDDLEEYLRTIETQEEFGAEPVQTIAFQRMLQRVIMHARSAAQEEIEIGDVIVSIFSEEDSYARYFLEKQGISKLDVLNYISHGIVKDDMDSLDISNSREDDESIMGGFFHDLPSGREEDEEIDVEEEPTRHRPKSLEKYIEKFAVDMTRMASDGKYDALIGRESELRRTIEILSRRTKNNPIHVGEPGVGKTAVTEGLAQAIVRGDVPERFRGFSMYAVDMGALIAGTKFRGEFEERVKMLFRAFAEKEKVIIFIDEIHTIVGAGAVQGGSMDASNLLKPLLADGEIRCIGSTTYDEYKQYFEKDRALSRRFQRVEIVEPTVDESIRILNGLKMRYEEFHGVLYSGNAIRAACELSAKFINDRRLPDKAIDVMDEAGASVSIYRKARRIVSVKDIEKLVSRMAKIPLQTVTQREKDSLRSLAERLNKVVYGQKEAIDRIVNAVKRHRSGLGHPEKPVGSFLFIGPTGVGKTELCRQLASGLGIELIRFDMSEFMEKHTISRLLGSPPGYVGYDQGAMLTDQIRKTPHAVLLLDEIEKAHPDIFNALLQIMDHATLTDNTGRAADFRNIILVMTSNAGSKEMASMKIGFSDSGVAFGDPLSAVKKIFSPEFRNRLDDIILFGNLDRDIVKRIVRKFIGELENQLRSRRVSFALSEDAVEYLADKGFSPELGARPMARLIQTTIKDPIVDKLLFGELQKGGSVEIKMKDGGLSIECRPLRKDGARPRNNP